MLPAIRPTSFRLAAIGPPSATMATIARKLVVIGDGACGKTCLLIVFANNEFPEVSIPRVWSKIFSQTCILVVHV